MKCYSASVLSLYVLYIAISCESTSEMECEDAAFTFPWSSNMLTCAVCYDRVHKLHRLRPYIQDCEI